MLKRLFSKAMLRTLNAQLRQFFFLGPGDLADLVSSRHHSLLFSRYRARFILSRVRMMAAIFALLTPLWIFIDFAVFPSHLAMPLATARLLTSTAFALLAIYCRCTPSMGHGRAAVALILSIPTAFFVFSRILLAGAHLNAIGTAMSAGYAFLPFVLLATLALFPLVALETLMFSLPMLSIFLISDSIRSQSLLSGFNDLAVFWLLLLIAVVVSMASLSQLQLMKGLFHQSSLDPLTHLFNRRSGEQFLQLQMAQAKRHDFPLSIAFLDLDDFKQINDQYGHEVGDRMLQHTAETMKAALRESDALIRWGGEEFLVIMPFATAWQAAARLGKIADSRVMQRPDGRALTWSSGIAQWPLDAAANSWQEMVTLADARMYRAKTQGKGRVVTQ